MADGFYLKHGNQEYGPMDSNKLRQLAAQNKISPTDLIRRGTDGKWILASNVKGLFSEQRTAKPTAVPANPIITSQQPKQVSVPPLSSSMSFENLGDVTSDDSPRKTSKHGGKRGKKKEPMDQKTMLIVSIVGGVALLLVVIAILIFIFINGKKQESKPADNLGATQTAENADGSAEAKPVADGENPEAATGEDKTQPADGENADGTAPADNTDKAGADNPNATNGEQKATSAPKNAIPSTEVGKAGDLEVKIASVKRGVQDTIQKDGTEDMSDDKSTIITLSVKNVNEEKTVNFTPWSVGLSRGMKSASLTDNNGNVYPNALKSGEIAVGVKKETATLYSDDPAVTDILVFKRFVPAAKELYLTLPVPSNMKENIVFKIDVANIGKESTEADADAQPADGNGGKSADEKADDKKTADSDAPATDNTATDNTADVTDENENNEDYNLVDGVSEEAQKRDQEQADKELKELNLGDEE